MLKLDFYNRFSIFGLEFKTYRIVAISLIAKKQNPNTKKRKAKNKVHLFTIYAKCNTETLHIIPKNVYGFTAWHDYFTQF